jgi:hypothetical protein
MRYGVDALPHVRYVHLFWGVYSLLGARRQNLSRLRVEKLGCAGSRQVIPAASLSASTANQVRVYIKSSRSPRATGIPLCCSSWAVSSRYLPKTGQHLQPLQIFNQKFWPCKKPSLAGKTFPSPKLVSPRHFNEPHAIEP